LEAVATELGYPDVASMYVAVGEGHVSPVGIAQRVARELRGGDFEEQLPAEPTRSRPSRERRRSRAREGVGVHVEGLDDVMVRLSRCCTPVPGDEIVGFVTRGRGVSVHRADCANSNSLKAGAAGRMIEVEWDGSHSPKRRAFVVSIMVESLDRARLLADVARVLSDNHVNVLQCSTHTGADRVARQKFEFEMADPSHLESVLREVRKVESVFDAFRIVPGSGRD
jgi:GTP diphosphokinase / guanosine-3',5'-bis(diphosphate) 3'-diphosphatase